MPTAWSLITELATGYPGYNGVMPFENGMLSEILVEQGYSTFMVGKWHLTPSNQETAAGPYDRWPLGRGFERFYGFLGGDTSRVVSGPWSMTTIRLSLRRSPRRVTT